jgi:hypothetical protein
MALGIWHSFWGLGKWRVDGSRYYISQRNSHSRDTGVEHFQQLLIDKFQSILTRIITPHSIPEGVPRVISESNESAILITANGVPTEEVTEIMDLRRKFLVHEAIFHSHPDEACM